MNVPRLCCCLLALTGVLALGGCDMSRSSTSTPTSPTSAAAATPVPPASSVPSLIGTWKSAAAVGSPGATSVGSCSDFVWTVTTQTATDVSGSFSGTCLGSASITGTGTGHIDGSSVTININGNGSMSGLPSCPFSIGGTGTISGETIAVPYNGSTCLGPLSGTQTLQRSLLQPAPVAPALRDPVDGATVSSRRPSPLRWHDAAPARPRPRTIDPPLARARRRLRPAPGQDRRRGPRRPRERRRFSSIHLRPVAERLFQRD